MRETSLLLYSSPKWMSIPSVLPSRKRTDVDAPDYILML